MNIARRLALTAALSLPALSAGAFPLEFGRTRNPISHPRIPGGYYDVNQDTAALFNDSPSQRFAVDGTVFFGILSSQSRSRQVTGSGDAAGGSSAHPHWGSSAGTPAPEPGALALFAAALSLAVTRFGRRTR